MEAERLERCENCDYWRKPESLTPGSSVSAAHELGHCDLFVKKTPRYHGAKCTGWRKKED